MSNSHQHQFGITQSFNTIKRFLYHSSQIKNLKSIMQIHAHLLTTGLLFSSYNIHSKLILSYTNGLNKNNLKTLTNFFKSINLKNPLPFNVLISEFCRNGFHFFALKTFSFMHFNGVPLDTYALCSSLLSSSLTKDVKLGNRIHSHVVKSGWLSSVFVGSALIDVYAKSQFISDAEMVFDEMPVKNTVCANALLSAYGEAKLWIEGLELFRKMPVLNLEYDHFTLSAMLRAFAGLSAIELGRQVHAHSIRKVHDVGNDVILQSSLIEMYGKCGLAGKALQVFSLTGRGQRGERKRDVVLWTSMLGVYGRNGQFEEVIELFKVMLMEGIIPDGVAFVTVISACGHTGQVQLGIDYFESMTRDCKLDPQPAHYSCLVDLLCRAGEVDKAWKLVNEMIHGGHGCGSVSMWGTLLSACKDHANVELANLAAKKALELDPQNIGIYVMLRNLYAKLGMWEEIERLRELIKGRELKKDVGCSWIQITN